MLYPSDYGFASNGSNSISRNECINLSINDSNIMNCFSNNWIYNLIGYQNQSNNAIVKFTIMPLALNEYADCSVGIFNGYYDPYESTQYNILPTLYLKQDLSIISGTGTSSDPYRLNIEGFDYTGSSQTYTIAKSGTYKIETWGAQGGSYHANGGYGGYSVGNINLTNSDDIYVVVGGSGSYTDSIGGAGYNGGGTSGVTVSGGGGGATHVAYYDGLLSTLEQYKGSYDSTNNVYNSHEIIMVSGGGGGTGCDTDVNCTDGGNAGGFNGSINSTIFGGCLQYDAQCYGMGGTQTLGGTSGKFIYSGENNSASDGSFGQGGSGKDIQIEYGNGGGGGAGFFGGGGAAYNSGGGGSGYIGNQSLTNKHMTCYNCQTNNDLHTKTITNQCHSLTPQEDCAKEGNGYAQITYLGE